MKEVHSHIRRKICSFNINCLVSKFKVLASLCIWQPWSTDCGSTHVTPKCFMTAQYVSSREPVLLKVTTEPMLCSAPCSASSSTDSFCCRTRLTRKRQSSSILTSFSFTTLLSVGATCWRLWADRGRWVYHPAHAATQTMTSCWHWEPTLSCPRSPATRQLTATSWDRTFVQSSAHWSPPSSCWTSRLCIARSTSTHAWPWPHIHIGAIGIDWNNNIL